MGTQQYLFVILGLVVVGVSIVVGMNLTSANAFKSNEDEVLTECLHLASEAQSWYRKPASLGGGGNSFCSLSFFNLEPNTRNNSKTFTKETGTYIIQCVNSGYFELRGQTHEYDQDGVQALYRYMVYPHRIVGPMRIK